MSQEQRVQKVVVDHDVCAGVGYCARVAPEMFELVADNGEDKAVARADADSPEREQAAINAQLACPTGAIWLEPGEAGP